MSEPQTQEEFLKEWNERLAKEAKEQAKREEEEKKAKLARIDRIRKENIVPIKDLVPLKIKEDPLHLSNLEIELFRFFEVNRDKAYTFEGILVELEDQRTKPFCYWISPYDPKDRSKLLDRLKDMVLNRKLGGEYGESKKDYFYFFKIYEN